MYKMETPSSTATMKVFALQIKDVRLVLGVQEFASLSVHPTLTVDLTDCVAGMDALLRVL